MKSVPCTKSGVLVTSDVVAGGEGLTVAMAWGVGGVVDGEAAETLVLEPDGSFTLVSEARSPYYRYLDEDGGVAWGPCPIGAVLDFTERDQIRQLAADVRERMTPVLGVDGRPLPWDVELGFVDGRLQLFQVRPLVEQGRHRADGLVAALAAVGPSLPRTPLREPPEAPPPPPPAQAAVGGAS
jgi:hypothetical protein